MHKVKILDVNQDKQVFEKNLKSNKQKRKKDIEIKINDSLFEIGLRKGLIEKNDDGYYFIGDYEELLAFKNNGPSNEFELLD
ncbi:MAG: hypothetical protein JSW62_03740 [Thermoplasmatales archaeon]|nr:MAG: hypothetical protein JSW62_03740 [Thermoplasmatales archaeon]